MKQNGATTKNDQIKCKNSYTSTIKTPLGTPGVSKDAPSFTKLEFGACKLSNLQKPYQLKSHALSIRIWFLKIQVWKIQFDDQNF